MGYASAVCDYDENAGKTVMTQQKDMSSGCHDIFSSSEIEKTAETKQGCCEPFCDGVGCGKMPLVAPAEMTDFRMPPLSGYEVFDLTSNGTRLERLMRPPIFR